MSRRFVVVAEDRQAFTLVTDLGDRVIAERSTWLRDHWEDEASRLHHRTWTSFERSDQAWSSRSDVKRLAQQHGIRTHGMGLKAEGAIAHKAVAIARKLSPNVEVNALRR